MLRVALGGVCLQSHVGLEAIPWSTCPLGTQHSQSSLSMELLSGRALESDTAQRVDKQQPLELEDGGARF